MVGRQHAYVKCDCEEANGRRRAVKASTKLGLCEGEERSRGLYSGSVGQKDQGEKGDDDVSCVAFVRAANRLPQRLQSLGT